MMNIFRPRKDPERPANDDGRGGARGRPEPPAESIIARLISYYDILYYVIFDYTILHYITLHYITYYEHYYYYYHCRKSTLR